MLFFYCKIYGDIVDIYLLRSGQSLQVSYYLFIIPLPFSVCRYPFNDSEHASLFLKISRGQFVTPDSLSPKAKCLIRSLLRRDPGERLSSEDTLHHPWLREGRDSSPDERDLFAPPDQTVPDIDFDM